MQESHLNKKFVIPRWLIEGGCKKHEAILAICQIMKIWVLRKQKILVKLSKNVSPEFAASVLETNAVATEEHDLDFSFCLMTSLSMFQQLFSLRGSFNNYVDKI